MTRKDVIFQLNDLKRDAMSHFTDDGDDDIFRADVEALDAAISALRAQQEQESNVPLTLDELRQMEGKPVWAIDGTGTAAYILIDADGNGIDTDSGFWDADYYGMTKDGKHGLHRMGWLAYRRKPKEGDSDG